MTKGEVMNLIKSVIDRETDRMIDRVINQVMDIIMTHTRAYEGVPKDGYKIARHKIGSTDTSRNWIEYWEENNCQKYKVSSLVSYPCPSCLMMKKDLVGGHVVSEDKTYITPVCRECNSKYKKGNAREHAFYVKEEYMVHAPKD